MTLIRSEKKKDYKRIKEINNLAFGRKDEGDLIDKIRQADDFNSNLSLVAVVNDEVVGHILFSPIIIENKEESYTALALAPMVVKPDYQNKGIGSELVKQGLEKCKNIGHKIVVVLGHSEFYSKFGFIPAKEKEIEPPFEVPSEAFRVKELEIGALNDISGMVKYPSAFNEV